MSKLKTRTSWVCLECGSAHVKWQGQCRGCGAWNTLVEEIQSADASPEALAYRRQLPADTGARLLDEIPDEEGIRMILPDGEFNRVLDGGLVQGSLVLLAGEPGIGKSTLLLQLALQASGEPVLYVTGEESPQQVKLRGGRIPHKNERLYLYSQTDLDSVLNQAAEIDPAILIIDSIQTLSSSRIDSAPGSVSQVRECTLELMKYAKKTLTAIILVGHVTKDGQIAGPRVLEHMVDVVLEFEGDRHYNYRLLRATKNRFGATPSLGVYEMYAQGIRAVENPSELFMGDASSPEMSGIAISAILQGLSPLLIETQALTAEALYGTPQRSAIGLEVKRLQMLLAVLEKKCGLSCAQRDVFVNLAGGLRLDDPSLDLALVCAIASSLTDISIDRRTAFAAEVGLTGELRAISRPEARLAEVHRLGFKHLILSEQSLKGLDLKKYPDLEVHAFRRLDEVVKHLGLRW
jgi:DNA repair protein RadA/Sms